MNIAKEQKRTDEESIDTHIAKLLEGKNDSDAILATLRTDIMKRKPEAHDMWEQIYNQYPSYRHVNGQEYQSLMREKCITVYKRCLEKINQ